MYVFIHYQKPKKREKRKVKKQRITKIVTLKLYRYKMRMLFMNTLEYEVDLNKHMTS